MVYAMPGADDKAIAAGIGVNPFFAKDYLSASRKYDYAAVERILLLLNQYNLRSLGVNDGGTSDAGLMKEMVVKMMQ